MGLPGFATCIFRIYQVQVNAHFGLQALPIPVPIAPPTLDPSVPTSQNDGSKDGETYFECKGPKYGCFSRFENCNVGDFPEEDPFACLDDDDEI